ncbi:hypothetical protein ACFOOL_06855 [Devosia honganensis]|uniref:Uncharacterized protein n=1 Tax=Devosia honganensis TaxID=1610527 RepID=A0ABV7X313_9HYPH
MRIWIVLISLALAAPSAALEAQSRVVEGCLAALAFGSAQEAVQPTVIQDFSALSPPRTRISFTIDGVDAPRPFLGSCEFTNAESPLGLIEMCVEDNCFSKGDATPRFDEINMLLEKAGF